MSDFGVSGAGGELKWSIADSAGAMMPMSYSGYDGANFSTRRGRIQWTSLDTRKELDSFSRAELLRRVRWLRANVGIIKGFIKNGASLIGWLTPQAMTKDEAWNVLSDSSFKRRAMQKGIFDVAGKYNFKTAQRMVLERALCDADILTVFTESSAGGAAVSFYESHQIRGPKGAKDVWVDGVRSNKVGRHLVYGVGDGDAVKQVAARDCHYFGWFESPGHGRAHPPLAHAVNHAMDITEVWADTKHGIKNAALLGVVKEKDAGSNPNQRSKAGLAQGMGIHRTVDVKDGDGEDAKVQVEEIWNGGQMPEGDPGEKYKVLTDGRPHPNGQQFVETLVADMACGYGLPEAVIWRMMKLTGPGVRFVMDVAGRWVEDWLLHLVDWCQRYWVYHMAKEIKAGRLPMPEDDDWMQGVEWTPRRSLTIDRGKDGKQRLDEVDAGYGTLADWYADVDGSGWRSKVKQRVREVKYAEGVCEEEGVDYDRVFRPRQGAAPAVASDSDEVKTGGSDDEEGG